MLEANYVNHGLSVVARLKLPAGVQRRNSIRVNSAQCNAAPLSPFTSTHMRSDIAADLLQNLDPVKWRNQ